jgi:hypothetical protein
MYTPWGAVTAQDLNRKGKPRPPRKLEVVLFASFLTFLFLKAFFSLFTGG